MHLKEKYVADNHQPDIAQRKHPYLENGLLKTLFHDMLKDIDKLSPQSTVININL